jgi:hypothetical protein
VLLLADLPGVKPSDVDVRFENGELTIHGDACLRLPTKTSSLGIRAGQLPPVVPTRGGCVGRQDRSRTEERRAHRSTSEASREAQAD